MSKTLLLLLLVVCTWAVIEFFIFIWYLYSSIKNQEIIIQYHKPTQPDSQSANIIVLLLLTCLCHSSFFISSPITEMSRPKHCSLTCFLVIVLTPNYDIKYFSKSSFASVIKHRGGMRNVDLSSGKLCHFIPVCRQRLLPRATITNSMRVPWLQNAIAAPFIRVLVVVVTVSCLSFTWVCVPICLPALLCMEFRTSLFFNLRLIYHDFIIAF